MPSQPTLGSGAVETISIVDRMEQAFLDYSMSVIVGRALPDARDGLKPVQRRILYSMWESGLHPDRPYRKCASAVGEVMKKYHPHGDTSIYDAMVRMSQDFSTREPLVDGHGNFGSVDGDPPAAMRYTEARLSALAMELLSGIDEETVDFVPNYDGYDEEPTVLPARFPNLLVNGAAGIAVGMATNIAPHNLGEVIDACVHLVHHPDASLDTLMKKVPAPDFPTGARIIESDGIRDAYATGRGAVTIEAVATTETRTGNLPRIVVTEIPYQVNKATLLEKIADLVQKKKLDAVRDLRDESSRDGMRIVIELKRGEDPAAVLAKLYSQTDLRTNFNVNCVALVDGAPRTLGLKEALEHYVAHQREVITRRSEYRLRKAKERAHILEGLLTALDHLDEVIALIRSSQTANEAKQGLMDRFELSEVQAQAVLDMRLRRLAALERAELEDEYQALQDTIAGLESILGDPEELDRVLVEELSEIKRVHATPRRSRLVGEGISAEDVLAGGSQAGFEAQEVTVLVTRGGYAKPVSRRRTSPAHKHGHDPVVAVVRCTTDDELLLVDEEGTGYRLPVGDVPVVRADQRGTHVAGVHRWRARRPAGRGRPAGGRDDGHHRLRPGAGQAHRRRRVPRRPHAVDPGRRRQGRGPHRGRPAVPRRRRPRARPRPGARHALPRRGGPHHGAHRCRGRRDERPEGREHRVGHRGPPRHRRGRRGRHRRRRRRGQADPRVRVRGQGAGRQGRAGRARPAGVLRRHRRPARADRPAVGRAPRRAARGEAHRPRRLPRGRRQGPRRPRTGRRHLARHHLVT